MKAPGAYVAEVVSVGDELLSGTRVNTNAAWLGSALASVGVPVVRGTTVGDDVEVIAASLRAAAGRADLVVVTGGLGPTDDDRTCEALARALGVDLVVDQDVHHRITSWYRGRGRTPGDDVLRQALVPRGARTLANAVGTAPGLRAELGGSVLVCLPGVPAEMTSIVENELLPELRERFEGGVAVAELRTVLVGESAVAETIAEVADRAQSLGVAVAYLPSVAEVVVRFVGVGEAADQAAVDALADDAARLLGPAVAVRGSRTLAEEVVRLALTREVTIATAESLTGGLVSAALTSVPGASAVVRGGVVAYATDLKHALLGVDDALLDQVGPVDSDVASAMAAGARARLGTDLAVAVTGVAGPDAQAGHAPGTVHVAVVGPRGELTASPVLHGGRERIRAATVTHALEMLRRTLVDLG